MPPNITNSQNGEQQVRSRKVAINGTAKANENLEKTAEIQEDKTKAKTETKPKSILIKILNFVVYFTLILVFAVAFFIFVPWEDYVFDENELQNYIDMYSQGENADGDWVSYQFLATAEQNITDPV